MPGSRRSLYGELIEEVGLLNGHAGGAAETLASRIHHLMELAQLPTHPVGGRRLPRHLPVFAEEANQQWTARFNPRPVTEEDILALYEAAL